MFQGNSIVNFGGPKPVFFFLILALALAACQPVSQSGPPVTEPAQPASASTQPAAVPLPGGGEGLTFEEMRRTTPPAPVELNLAVQATGIRLDWAPAPAVTIPHAYSDTVRQYNIYRRLAGETDLQLLATVEVPYFVDENVTRGVTYFYAVSAVHEGPVEGQRADEISILVP